MREELAEVDVNDGAQHEHIPAKGIMIQHNTQASSSQWMTGNGVGAEHMLLVQGCFVTASRAQQQMSCLL